MKESLKKIGTLLLLFLMVVGALSAIGYLIMLKAWLALVGCLFVIAGCVPTVIKLFKYLIK